MGMKKEMRKAEGQEQGWALRKGEQGVALFRAKVPLVVRWGHCSRKPERWRLAEFGGLTGRRGERRGMGAARNREAVREVGNKQDQERASGSHPGV